MPPNQSFGGIALHNLSVSSSRKQPYFNGLQWEKVEVAEKIFYTHDKLTLSTV